VSNDTIAGSGLEKMFYGQILSILVIIPLVGWIAAIVGIVLFLVGLHEAAGADEGYRTADMMAPGCTRVGCTEMGNKILEHI